MIRKVKNWLGIEGIRLALDVDDKTSLKSGLLKGKLQIIAKKEETISSIEMRLIERYARGRRKSKLIDEFVMGETILDDVIFLSPEELYEFEFDLPFQVEQSEMDRLENKNILLKGFVKTAKLIKGVKSVYRLEVNAKVKGQALKATSTTYVNFT